MEGIIPMVYKALKKKKTRRQYECLSSGVAQTYNNMSVDFYAQQGYSSNQYMTVPLQLEMTSTIGGGGGSHAKLITSNNGYHHHRRHKSSIGDYSTGFSTPEDTMVVDKPPKQLMRFRSHRFFSCVTA